MSLWNVMPTVRRGKIAEGEWILFDWAIAGSIIVGVIGFVYWKLAVREFERRDG